MLRLLNKKVTGSQLDIAVLACSKGAEVHSITWSIRSARPDLKFNMRAVDISREVVEFAKRGIYSRAGGRLADRSDIAENPDVTRNTELHQQAPIFERMSSQELDAMFEVDEHQMSIQPWLKEGVTWSCADACDPELITPLGLQDIVVANRFLCHMEPAAAESCLRNIARLVKPGGYLFVSGVDLDVRAAVAKQMGWKPVTDLMKEIHEGDPSLTQGWPLEYWGLEPFCKNQSDWMLRYASVFQIGEDIFTPESPSR
jgi:hypothetical protein